MAFGDDHSNDGVTPQGRNLNTLELVAANKTPVTPSEPAPPAPTPDELNSILEAASEGKPNPVAEPTEDVSTDAGQVNRIRQQMEKSNKLLAGLGIDPSSDIADKYTAGIYSKEDLLELMGIHSGQPQVPTAQPKSVPFAGPANTLQEVIDRVNREGASEKDFVEALSAVQSALTASQQEAQANDLSNTLNQCASSTKRVIQSHERHTALPADLQAVEEQLFLAATDNLVLREAQNSPNPNAFLSPNSYGYYANRFNNQYQKLVNHYINVGRQMQKQGMAPVHGSGVNPVSPSLGSGPSEPASVPINRDNWKEAARAYMNRQGVV